MIINPPFSKPFTVPSGGVSFSAAAQSVIDRMTTLAAGEANKIAASIDAGITAGELVFDVDTSLFTPIDSFFSLMLESEANKSQDWFSAITGSFPEGFTDVLGKGASFNGTDEYFDTGIDLDTLTNYSLNDAYSEGYMYENRDAGVGALFGVRGGAGRTYMIQDGSDILVRVNTGTSLVYPPDDVFDDNAKYGGKRDASNSQELIKNSVSVDDEADGSTSIPTGENMAIATFNSNGTPGSFIDATISYWFAGATEAANYVTFTDEIKSQWALDV